VGHVDGIYSFKIDHRLTYQGEGNITLIVFRHLPSGSVKTFNAYQIPNSPIMLNSNQNKFIVIPSLSKSDVDHGIDKLLAYENF
jgi:hypothetical protein